MNKGTYFKNKENININSIQRRKYPRFAIENILIELESTKKDTIIKGRVIDLSKKGLKGEFSGHLPLLERVNIKIEVIDNKNLRLCECNGRIMWANRIEDQIFHYGVTFLNLEYNSDKWGPLMKYIDDHAYRFKKGYERRGKNRRKKETDISQNRRKLERRISKSIFEKCISTSSIDFLKKQDVFFRIFSNVAKPKVIMGDKEVCTFSYCNYLGLNNHPEIKKIMSKALEQYGTTTASSRLLGGTTAVHIALEKELAEFIGGEDGLTYAMGYLANQGCISTLVHKNEFVFMDDKSHASIVDACMLSRGEWITYKHNDMKHLEICLKKCTGNKLIISDGVFSMDGDIAKLDEIYYLAQKYNAGIMIDDAHGFGVLGESGAGLPEYFGLKGKIDIVMGTLSKAIPLLGGYVVGNKKIIDYLRYRSRAFIFNLSLPPYIVEGAIVALNIIKQDAERRQRLWENINYMRENIKNFGFDVGNSKAGIIPIFIRDVDKTHIMSEMLESAGILVDAVCYPAVKKRESLLRIVVTSEHSFEDIKKSIFLIKKIGKKLNVI